MPISMAARSKRAQGRVERRTIRLIKRKEPLTHEHLVGELMMSQIDATLAVSHAIQELSLQLGVAGLQAMRQHPPFSFELNTRQLDIVIGTLSAEIRGLHQRVDRLEKDIPWEPVQPVAQPRWWQEADWVGWLLLLIFVVVVWFLIMYNFDSFVDWFGGR